MDAGGIYEVVNIDNGNRYVGSALKMSKRWRAHRLALDKGRHQNRYLQRSWMEHGREAFVFRPLLICAPHNLLMYEQACIDGLKPTYNMAKTAGSSLGIIRSSETKDKLRRAKLGSISTIETRLKMSASHVGIKHTAIARQKISAGKAGRQLSEEHKQKLRKPKSPEAKAKMSAAAKARPASYYVKRSATIRANRMRLIGQLNLV